MIDVNQWKLVSLPLKPSGFGFKDQNCAPLTNKHAADMGLCKSVVLTSPWLALVHYGLVFYSQTPFSVCPTYSLVLMGALSSSPDVALIRR